MAKAPDSQRWYRLTGDDAASRINAIVDAIKTETGSPLQDRWFKARSMYEGRPITADDVMKLMGGKEWSEDLYNVTRSGVDTVQADIAARQRPKPMFLTTGATWRVKRKAKKLDKFVEGCMSQRQGARYADVWELAEDVFRDAAIAVGGCIKVVPDARAKKIRYERIPAYEVFVDPFEARRGDPQNWFHEYEMDLDVAIRVFTVDMDDEAKKEEIIAKLTASTGLGGGLSPLQPTAWRATDAVLIRESWRLPFGKEKGEEGRHAFVVRGGMLHEEDWTWPRPPFAFITWTKEPFGIWGVGLAESGATQHEMINDLSRRIHSRFVLNASRRTYYKPGTVDLEAMKRNDEEVFVPLNGDMPPITQDIPPITSAEVQFLDREKSEYYNVQGVSQMNAEQRKEPGVDAAVAIQTLNDIKGVRFMSKARAYELLFVALGELTVLAARDLAANDGDFLVNWPDKTFLRTINWKDVDLGNEMYEVRVAPVSAMSKDPAQRLQIIEQLTNMGFVSRERYFELLGMPDLDSVLNLEGAELQWIEKLIDRYLDADDDDELDNLGGFCEPEGYLTNPTAAMATTAQHYFEARLNDAPDYQLDLVRRFMSSLQRMLAPPVQQPSPAPMDMGQPAPVLPAAPAPAMAA